MTDHRLTIGQMASLACVLEASAPKPGNVHRAADFAKLTFDDFLISAVAIAPVMDAAVELGVGRTVRDAVSATRHWVADNTNLGIVLLLAPLAAVPVTEPLGAGVARRLASLTAEDARLVYEAIRIAEPGGLGQVDEMDVQAPPPDDLRAAMAAAADRDAIAKQYVTDFATVLDEALPYLVAACRSGRPLADAIVQTHVWLMSRMPDTLIARKCGPQVAGQAADRAADVIGRLPDWEAYHRGLADLDFWLRSDGQRRNPGATADLIAAALFASFRQREISPKMKA